MVEVDTTAMTMFVIKFTTFDVRACFGVYTLRAGVDTFGK